MESAGGRSRPLGAAIVTVVGPQHMRETSRSSSGLQHMSARLLHQGSKSKKGLVMAMVHFHLLADTILVTVEGFLWFLLNLDDKMNMTFDATRYKIDQDSKVRLFVLFRFLNSLCSSCQSAVSVCANNLMALTGGFLSWQVDSSDNLYVTGYSASTDFDSQTNTGNYDVVLVKLNVAGEHQWTAMRGSSANDYAHAIAAGRVFLAHEKEMKPCCETAAFSRSFQFQEQNAFCCCVQEFPARCPTRVSCKSVHQECGVLSTSVQQGCPPTVSQKSVQQKSLARVSHKSISKECQARVFHKSASLKYPTRVTRVSSKSVLQTCPVKPSHKSVPQHNSAPQ